MSLELASMTLGPITPGSTPVELTTAGCKRLSAFDLDHTLLKENSSFGFGRFLYQKKYIGLSDFLFMVRSYALYYVGFLSITELHKKAYERLFRGKPRSLIEQWVTQFLDARLDSLLYPPAFEVFMEARQAGHLTAILSSSPSFIVEPIAKRFGVTYCQSTQYAVDEDGCFSSITDLMLGEDKARFIVAFTQQHQCSKQQISAYSDSFSDLPFLLAAGNAVGVNPDRKLRLYCLKNHWSIL